jgi:hypothetical protein
MGYSMDRSYRVKEKYRSIILDIYSAAKCFKSPHADILARLSERVYDQPDYKKLPHWAIASLLETLRCKLDEVHRHELVWTHEVDGVRFIAGQLPEGVTYFDINAQSDKSYHAWKGDLSKRF